MISCHHCFDSGLCYVTDDSAHFFMICSCPSGDKNTGYRIPRWDKHAERIYTRTKFKLDNWLPRQTELWGLIEAWREKVRQAEQYWANEIDEHRRKQEGKNDSDGKVLEEQAD